jgi:hypothetical protein
MIFHTETFNGQIRHCLTICTNCLFKLENTVPQLAFNLNSAPAAAENLAHTLTVNSTWYLQGINEAQDIHCLYIFFKLQYLEVLQDVFWCNNDCTLQCRQQEGVVSVLAYHCTSNYRMELQVCYPTT